MNEIQPRIPSIITGSSIICGFTTRFGGVSPKPFDSLNLGFNTPDDPANTAENISRFQTFLHVERSDIALMEQVHGVHVAVVDRGGRYPATDGLISGRTNVLLTVSVADCIPLLLYDPVQRVIGAIHCGWRPIVGSIAGRAVKIFTRTFGSKPADILAVMGPSAGSCCYEIGDDVSEILNPSSVIERGGGQYADLRAELCTRLTGAGVTRSNIEIFSDCTICGEDLYFSYRRDGMNSGRMMGYIMMKARS
jgi:YfiH family protein